jgi:hypothetical protein
MDIAKEYHFSFAMSIGVNYVSKLRKFNQDFWIRKAAKNWQRAHETLLNAEVRCAGGCSA